MINRMPDGKGKEKEDAKFWWCIKDEDCFTTVFGDKMEQHIIQNAYPDQIVFRLTECKETEQQDSNPQGSELPESE